MPDKKPGRPRLNPIDKKLRVSAIINKIGVKYDLFVYKGCQIELSEAKGMNEEAITQYLLLSDIKDIYLFIYANYYRATVPYGAKRLLFQDLKKRNRRSVFLYLLSKRMKLRREKYWDDLLYIIYLGSLTGYFFEEHSEVLTVGLPKKIIQEPLANQRFLKDFYQMDAFNPRSEESRLKKIDGRKKDMRASKYEKIKRQYSESIRQFSKTIEEKNLQKDVDLIFSNHFPFYKLC